MEFTSNIPMGDKFTEQEIEIFVLFAKQSLKIVGFSGEIFFIIQPFRY